MIKFNERTDFEKIAILKSEIRRLVKIIKSFSKGEVVSKLHIEIGVLKSERDEWKEKYDKLSVKFSKLSKKRTEIKKSDKEVRQLEKDVKKLTKKNYKQSYEIMGLRRELKKFEKVYGEF